MDIKEQTTRRIQSRIDSGSYSNADDVVERALDALDEVEGSDEELRQALVVGIAELDRGEAIPSEDVFAQLRSKHQTNLDQSNA